MTKSIFAASILAAMALPMLAAPRPAEAAPYWPWCSRYLEEAQESCAFATYEQCMASVRGIGGFCYRNPSPPPSSPYPQRTRRHTPEY
jgi:hypothetical protein